MLTFEEHLHRVLEIAQSQRTGLKEIAASTSLDVHTFYQGADLRGLDLSGQDLRGLSFDKANMAGTNLQGVSYSPGAFNGSQIDPAFDGLKDAFDYYLYDAIASFLQRVHLFGRFRDSSVDSLLSALSFSFNGFAAKAKISTSTLRNARRSKLVSMDTIRSIGQTIFSALDNMPRRAQSAAAEELSQPLISFTYISSGGKHLLMTKKEVDSLLRVMRYIDLREPRYSRTPAHLWRDSPGVIAWLTDYKQIRDDLQPEDRALVQRLSEFDRSRGTLEEPPLL